MRVLILDYDPTVLRVNAPTGQTIFVPPADLDADFGDELVNELRDFDANIFL